MNDFESIYDDAFDDNDEGVIVNPNEIDGGIDNINSVHEKDNEDQFDDRNPNLPEGFLDDDKKNEDDDISVSYEKDDDRDVIADLLKFNNIDPESISIEGEDGEVVEKNFGELTYEEQLELLKFNYSEAANTEKEDKNKVSEDELSLVKYLRDKKMSVNDLLEDREAQVIARYEKDQDLSIDGYSDEELYVYDIVTRLPHLSDEDVEARLEAAMMNEDLFKKEVSGLRESYTKYELDEKERVRTEASQKQATIENERKAKFQEVLGSVNSFADEVIVEDSDKDELMRYIFNKDIEGKTALDRDREDEEKLFQMAFFSKFGEDAINVIKNNYEKRIKDVEATAYAKGKSEAINGMPSKPTKSFYRPKVKKQGRTEDNILNRKMTPTELDITGGKLSTFSSMYDN